MADAIAKQISQLEEARKHVLADAVHYSAIIPGILPIIGSKAHLDIRRWGTAFLAEGFASPVLQLHAKEALSVQVLPLLKELLDNPEEDEYVIKSVIQTAACIFGSVFRHITNNPQNAQSWSEMAAIKSSILKRFDTAPVGIRVCCIKFVQRVVLVQTPGVITDPRRPEQNEISLALVPREHPLIPPPHLEAEASGLLDRLLNVFYEEHSNAILVDATLNCLPVLVRTRQTISNKIMSTVLNFNPFKKVHDGIGGKEKVLIRSMERTTRLFLMNIYRKNDQGPFAARIRQYVDRMAALRLEFFEEGSRKRGPPEPTDGLDGVKRARLGAQLNDQSLPPPLPAGPVSIAQLYTLTREESLKSFDVQLIALDPVVRITSSVFQRVDAAHLDIAINAVRSRYLEISRQPPPPGPALIPVDPAYEEDEDYEPEYVPEPEEDEAQIRNRLDPSPAEEAQPETDLTLKAFNLPQPPPVTFDEAEGMGKGAISRVFSMMSKLEEPAKAQKAGLNRLAGSNFDREAWVTMITRLATRANPDLPDSENNEDGEDTKAILLRAQEHSLGDGIRETLWKFVVEDFRHRIDIAISWLNEEWYNDRMLSQSQSTRELKQKTDDLAVAPRLNYEKWTLKLLDAIVPYLDANDKVLVRFLGEIPEVSQTLLDRVKNLARDPDRVSLAVKAIYYLVAFKPPAKEMAINALEDLWTNYEEAKASVRPLLARVRPNALGDIAPAAAAKKEGSSTPAPPVKESTPIVRNTDSPAPPQGALSPAPIITTA